MLNSLCLASMMAAFTGAPFEYIRLGDIDGFGFIEGVDPCGADPCWPFGSPWQEVIDFGATCAGGALVNFNGDPINVDGADVLGFDDYLPDLDCSMLGGTAYQMNSDEFDNRSATEVSGGSFGTYVETSQATDLGSSGSGWTDVAVSGATLGPIGWNNCMQAPSWYVCGNGNLRAEFDFEVTDADPSAPIYLNALMGDYDLDNNNDALLVTTWSGTTSSYPLLVEGDGDDGHIQKVTVELAFTDVFGNWPADKTGKVNVEFFFMDELLLAWDYVELSTDPLVASGCCCYPDIQNYWRYEMMTEDECDDHGGYYMGDGVECPPDDPAWGACCVDVTGGTACIDTQDCHCEELGGEFHEYTVCADLPCGSSGITGCCCFYDLGSATWTYAEMTGSDCLAKPMGSYAGDGTSCGLSPYIPGACCIGGLVCHDEIVQCECDAQGGDFHPGANCDDIEAFCTPFVFSGACCYIDPETLEEVCEVTNEQECHDIDGDDAQWHLGLSCASPLTCGSPFGACCNDGVCTLSIERFCELSGGTFHAGKTCDDVFCIEFCPGDIIADGYVNISDLLALLDNWGACN